MHEREAELAQVGARVLAMDLRRHLTGSAAFVATELGTNRLVDLVWTDHALARTRAEVHVVRSAAPRVESREGIRAVKLLALEAEDEGNVAVFCAAHLPVHKIIEVEVQALQGFLPRLRRDVVLLVLQLQRLLGFFCFLKFRRR